jgi:hypothetical protein
MNKMLNAWYFLYILAAILSIILIYTPSDSGKIDVFLAWLTGLLSLVGFILYIIWLTQFNNKSVLRNLWIGTLIATIVLTASWIFIDNVKLQATALQLSGYSFVIFVGAIISFFTKNKLQ